MKFTARFAVIWFLVAGAVAAQDLLAVGQGSPIQRTKAHQTGGEAQFEFRIEGGKLTGVQLSRDGTDQFRSTCNRMVESSTSTGT